MKILYNTGSEFKESKESTDKMMVKVAEDNGNIVEKSVQELVSNSFYDIKRLIGTEDTSDANSSVRAIARNELAKQLVPENASDALDTLQEIADWIQDHPDDASQMNSRIDALEEAVPFVLYIQNGVYGYKNANNEFVPFKSQADIDAAVSAAMVGTATAADVLSGKTFTNSSNSGVSGSMPARTNGTSATGSGIDNTGPWVYMPYGYYPEYSGNAGNSYIYMTAAQAANACPKQEKTVTAGTSAASVTPDSGKLLSKVTYNPTPSQTKSTTSSRSAQTITPDSGKLLSSVSIAKYPDASGNYTCGSNNGAASSNDMGATNNYRYVNATNVYNKGVSDGKNQGPSSATLMYANQQPNGTYTATSPVALSTLTANCYYLVVVYAGYNTGTSLTYSIYSGSITILYQYSNKKGSYFYSLIVVKCTANGVAALKPSVTIGDPNGGYAVGYVVFKLG